MLLLTVLVLALASSNSVSTELDDIKKLALANNEVAFKLHKCFNFQENAFYSPISIFVALGMLYQGARGVTANEMRNSLSYDVAGLDNPDFNQNFQELLSFMTQKSNPYMLDISNIVLSEHQHSVSEGYKEILKNNNAMLKEVDFHNETEEVIQEVNNWIHSKTGGNIPSLLESLDPNTGLILLNAVYFKGVWENQFSPDKTSNKTFNNDGLNAVSIPMMEARRDAFYGEEDNFTLLKLPYKGENVSIVFILPNEKIGLSEVEQELTADKLNSIVRGMGVAIVDVEIPKFTLKDSRDMKEALTGLGMISAFSDGADFSGISENGKLKMSKFIHKAVVEVNEEGTKASGVSDIEIVLVSEKTEWFNFSIDRPFLFFIRDEITEMILFFGRVLEL